MKKPKWRDIAEVVGIVTIVASLVFLGIETRQTQALSRAQLSAETYSYIQSISQSLLDPMFSSVYVKMHQESPNLSPEEVVQANAFLEQVLKIAVRELELAVVHKVFIEYDQLAQEVFGLYFSNPYAKNWWRVRRDSLHPFLVRSLGPLIDSVPNQAGRATILDPSIQ